MSFWPYICLKLMIHKLYTFFTKWRGNQPNGLLSTGLIFSKPLKKNLKNLDVNHAWNQHMFKLNEFLNFPYKKNYIYIKGKSSNGSFGHIFQIVLEWNPNCMKTRHFRQILVPLYPLWVLWPPRLEKLVATDSDTSYWVLFISKSLWLRTSLPAFMSSEPL